MADSASAGCGALGADRGGREGTGGRCKFPFRQQVRTLAPRGRRNAGGGTAVPGGNGSDPRKKNAGEDARGPRRGVFTDPGG